MAGSDKIGYGGPWEVMQIIGTTPVEQDGSAIFKIPANMPIAFQTLDDEGRAVQLMRSWVTAMPGEFMSCLGCHESPSQAASLRMPIASHKQPSKLDNWYGPPRGFDFEREVQPVLDRYCIECHNGNTKGLHDLRAKHFFPDYKGKKVTNMEIRRLHPVMLAETNGYFKYSPAYDALIPYIRRVGLQDDVSLLLPGHYHAGTSPLIQLLKKGHHNVELSNEAWERLYTWIDLNGPCHGTWNEVFPIQDGIAERRLELNIKYGGPTVDPEAIPEESHAFTGKAPYQRKAMGKPSPLSLDGWPLSQKESRDAQAGLGETEKVISLGNGLAIKLVKIPPGSYIMGNPGGQPDEPQKVVNIKEAFWMSSFEISNAIYRLYDPSHDSRYYSARLYIFEEKGLSLNEDNQPVVRVSWKEAMEFCQWLSDKTGMKFSLPTEEQFEYACRAGSATDLFFGNVKDDFTPFANLADKSFGSKNAGWNSLIPEGAYLADITRQDNYVVTSPVGTFQPNIWGLYDMHGNAAEWVKNAYTVPGSTTSGNDLKVVRGGSFFDHPSRAQSACRLAYPEWQRVFNVGFRVVAEIN
jgi:formylglycine-generating enzyme required for sulfatase activity